MTARPAGYIIELEPGCWYAGNWGDPGRTLVINSAKLYGSERAAKRGLAVARTYRPFANARICGVSFVVHD